MLPLLLLALLQAAPAPPQAPQRSAYESVIHHKGKTIGTTILIEVSGSSISGWIQKQDYYPIENSSVTGSGADTEYTFHAAGNTYQMNLRTSRIIYNGPDGSGNGLLVKMDPLYGRLYQLKEATEDGREIVIETDHGNQNMVVEESVSIWKHSGPPVRKFDVERFGELLGKTFTVWRVKIGGEWSPQVFEEPEGMDIQAHLPKDPKKKKK